MKREGNERMYCSIWLYICLACSIVVSVLEENICIHYTQFESWVAHPKGTVISESIAVVLTGSCSVALLTTLDRFIPRVHVPYLP